jgi:hypothetical protein
VKNIEDIIKLFDIKDTLGLYGCNLLIDLDNDWFDADAYQISVNGIVRMNEKFKVSKCGLIVFIDTYNKQITVLSLSHNKSSTLYEYKDYGHVLFQISTGRDICIVTEFKDTNIIKFKFRKSGSRRNKKETLIEKELSNSDEDRIIAEEMFRDGFNKLMV